MNTANKKKLLLAGGIALAALAVLAAAALAPLLSALRNDSYAWVVSLNWRLDLPPERACLYEADSGASFGGDGERYHVLEYGSGSGLEAALEREAEPLAPEEGAVTAILDGLSVPADRRPDYGDCRWFTASRPEDARDRLYLLANSGGTRLYVIESFL